MKAIVTGASSGIGADMARELSKRGYDIVLVARDKEKLKKVAESIKTNTEIHIADVSNLEDCRKLYEKYKDDDIDVLVNDAGFGATGNFKDIDLDTEIQMIGTNVIGLHALTKYFYKKFIDEDRGYILNVGSTAAFVPGPLMATYHATKSYVYRLTTSINYETKKLNKKTQVSLLSPGPTSTNFFNTAKCAFKWRIMDSADVAKLAIDRLFKRKLYTIPGFQNKFLFIFERFFTTNFVASQVYSTQILKNDKSNKK